MPKASHKSIVEEEEDAVLHGSMNPEEAKRHTCSLEDALDKLGESIRDGVTEGMMKITIEHFKSAIMEIAPYMEEASVASVLKSIKDISCIALMPPTSDREEKLEAMMPQLNILDLKTTVAQAKQLGDLTKEQKELIGELFNELEVTHESLARVSSSLGRLSRSLNSKQLLLTLRASIQPLVQINTLDKFWKDPILITQKAELPDNIHQRVQTHNDSRSIIGYHEKGKLQQSNAPSSSHTGFQTVKEVWRWHNTEEHAGSVQHAAKTIGSLYYWPQIPRRTDRLARKRRTSGEEPSTSSKQ